MPYNPSVQDRSGEILAQGITQGFSSLTQGVEKYYKKKEENEFLKTAIQGKLGIALNEMQKFQTNKAAYGGVAPLNPEMLEQFQNIGGASTAKLKALNADFDVMLQRSASALNESFTIAKTREMNAEANQRTVNAEQEKTAGILLRTIGGMTDPNARQKAILELPSAIQVRVVGALSALQKMNNETGTEIPPDVFKQLRDQGLNVTGMPMANGNIYATQVGTYAPPAVTNINTGDRAFEATVGKAAAERLGGQYDAAKSASRTAIPKLDQTLSILQNQEPNTGILAELATNVDRARATLLNEKGAAKRVSDTQLLESMLGSDVFTSLGAINLGSRNIDTPKEREFLQKVITGEIKLEKSTLIEMTKMRRKLQSQVIDNYNEDVKNGDYDEYFKAARMKPHTFDVPAIGGTTPTPLQPGRSGAPLPPGWTFNPQ